MNPRRQHMSFHGKAGIPFVSLRLRKNGFSVTGPVNKCENRQQSLTNWGCSLSQARLSVYNNLKGLVQFIEFKTRVQKLTNLSRNAFPVRDLAGNIPGRLIGVLEILFCYKQPFAEINTVFTETNRAFAETPEYQQALRVYLPLYYINS